MVKKCGHRASGQQSVLTSLSHLTAILTGDAEAPRKEGRWVSELASDGLRWKMVIAGSCCCKRAQSGRKSRVQVLMGSRFQPQHCPFLVCHFGWLFSVGLWSPHVQNKGRRPSLMGSFGGDQVAEVEPLASFGYKQALSKGSTALGWQLGQKSRVQELLAQAFVSERQAREFFLNKAVTRAVAEDGCDGSQQAEAGQTSLVRGQPWLHSDFHSRKGNIVRPFLKDKKTGSDRGG